MGAMFRYVEFGTIELHKQVAAPSVEGLLAHVAHVGTRMRGRVQRGSPKVYAIQDNSGFAPAGAAERKVLSEWVERDFELIRSSSTGLGFVIDSGLVRGALTAVFWFSRLPTTYQVHGTLSDALAAAIVAVEAEGLVVAAELKQGGAAVLAARAR